MSSDEEATDREFRITVFTGEDINIGMAVRIVKPDRFTFGTLEIVDTTGCAEYVICLVDDTDTKRIARHCELP